MLMAMRACGLKNDALMETFYEIVLESYHAGGDYAVLVFHDCYDIPAKGLDKGSRRRYLSIWSAQSARWWESTSRAARSAVSCFRHLRTGAGIQGM